MAMTVELLPVVVHGAPEALAGWSFFRVRYEKAGSCLWEGTIWLPSKEAQEWLQTELNLNEGRPVVGFVDWSVRSETDQGQLNPYACCSGTARETAPAA